MFKQKRGKSMFTRNRNPIHALVLACLFLTACTLPAPGQPVAIISSPDVGAVGLNDPVYPQMGNGGYDVTHYDIQLTVDMASNTITATTTIQAQAVQALRTFHLDFRDLVIDELQVNGQPASFSRNQSELTITPNIALVSGAAFTTTVVYHGQPKPIINDPGALAYPAMIGWIKWRTGVFVDNRTSGAMTWYPVNNHPTDKATYRFTITAPKPYVVAANGLLMDVRDGGDTRTYVWAENQPMASFVTTLAIAPFEVITDAGPNGLPIRHYVSATAPAYIIKELRETPAMIQFLSDLLGAYPFEAYGVAVLDAYSYLNAGNQTLSLEDMESMGTTGNLFADLASQWLGNSVSVATWQDLWLREGFSYYCWWLWVEHTKGERHFGAFLRGQYIQMQAKKMWPPAQPRMGYLFDWPVYTRAAWTLHALRLQIGDEAFFRLLRTWVERHQYGNASTADFIALAEEVSGQTLDDLFQIWLYTDETPPMPELPLQE
jgi:aminopeptidase N